MKLSSKKNIKSIWIVLLAAGLIGLSFLGGTWEEGYAFDPPTLPLVLDVDPSVIHVNTAYSLFTFTGLNYIGDPWDLSYTQIIWIGPDGISRYYTPDSISADGTVMQITFPLDLFDQIGTATIYIDNHPDDPDPRETSAPMYISIIDEVLFFPVISR